MTTTEPTNREELDAQWRAALIQINRRWGKMPYGASAHFAYFDVISRHAELPGRVEALELIGDNLDRLIKVLGRVAESNNADTVELRDLRTYLAHAGELGARMVSLAAASDAIERGGPVAGTLTRQREALEAILAHIGETPELDQAGVIATLAFTALVAGAPPAEEAAVT